MIVQLLRCKTRLTAQTCRSDYKRCNLWIKAKIRSDIRIIPTVRYLCVLMFNLDYVMKKVFLLAAVAVMTAACAKKPDVWTIDGTIQGVNRGMVTVWVYDSAISPETPTDKFEVAGGGVFSYTGKEIDRPMFCKMTFADSGGLFPDLMLSTFVVEPGAKLTFDGYVTGSPANDELAAMSGTMDSLYRASGEGFTPELIARFIKLQNDFIADNSDNMAGTLQFVKANTTLRGEIAPDPEAAGQFGKFSPEMQAVPAMIEIRHRIEDIKEEEAKFGGRYMEIVSASPEGAEVKLSDVVKANRLTLIDFWASWCGPCMVEMPNLKKIYAKYHDHGFEIFGVTLDDSKEAWTTAIAEHEMPWLHVGSLKGWEEPAAVKYGVRSIPASWLIDGEGNILDKNLRGEALENKVAEILD